MSESAPSTAVAAFVKTPGLSPVKTRLSETVGPEAALETYRTCLAALTGLFNSAIPRLGVSPYWAVAEEEAKASPVWKDFPTVVQTRSPGLAPRLHGVYSKLRERHPSAVLLVGADCPHLPLGFLEEAIRELSQDDCLAVVGPASDGGFTLFGSRENFPLSFWESVSYSRPDTLAQLVQSLQAWRGQHPSRKRIHRLAVLTDIDTQEDLEKAWGEYQSLSTLEPWPAQQRQALERLRPC